ncbi:MAG: hypothetical protein OEY07_20865 [Gammaproteobacteria bacterium]|nr:hypothetical protein [Gammaproteobacteria bacterium]
MADPKVIAAIIISMTSLVTSLLSLYIASKKNKAEIDNKLREEVREAFKLAREKADPTEKAIQRLWSLFQNLKHLIDNYFSCHLSERRNVVDSMRSIVNDIEVWHATTGITLDEQLRGLWHGQKNQCQSLVELAQYHIDSNIDPLSDERADFDLHRLKLSERQRHILEYSKKLSDQFTKEILEIIQDNTNA